MFLMFLAIPEPAAFKGDYCRRLDEVALADGECEAVGEEARTVFQLNAAILG